MLSLKSQMSIKENDIRIEDWIIKYFWILVLLPKMWQFILLLLYTMILIIKLKDKLILNRETIFICLYGVSHIVSILYNSIIGQHSLSRVAAAINTALIWLVAAGLYTCYLSYYSNVSLSRVSKYAFINLQVLSAVFMCSLFSVLCFGKEKIALFGRTFIEYENFEMRTVLRFVSGFEYPTLVIATVVLFMPLAVRYIELLELKEVKKTMYLVIHFVEIGIVVMFVQSRSGFVLYALSGLGYLFFRLLENRKVQNVLDIVKNKHKLDIRIVIACTILGLIMAIQVIRILIFKLLMYHPGSNNTRLIIYEETIQSIMKHPIIGAGIKEISSAGYPLGSHSSYLGFFFKAGIIGAVFAFIALTYIVVILIRRIAESSEYSYFAFNLLLMFLFFVFEDMDGADWLLCLFFTEIGIQITASKHVLKEKRRVDG